MTYKNQRRKFIKGYGPAHGLLGLILAPYWFHNTHQPSALINPDQHGGLSNYGLYCPRRLHIDILFSSRREELLLRKRENWEESSLSRFANTFLLFEVLYFITDCLKWISLRINLISIYSVISSGVIVDVESNQMAGEIMSNLSQKSSSEVNLTWWRLSFHHWGVKLYICSPVYEASVICSTKGNTCISILMA